METAKNVLYTYGFGIAAFTLACILIFYGSRCKKSFHKVLFYNLSAVCITLFLYEIYGTFINRNEPKVKYSGTFFDNPAVSGKKEHLGYGPREDTTFVATAALRNNDTLVYNVAYSLSNGIRATPGGNTAAYCPVWFTGCSFIFGDGLPDNQTLPFFFNKFTHSAFKVINYGFSGYGTHQALSIAEKKILKDTTGRHQGIVIYCFIPEHIARAAGTAAWDRNGPRYEYENNSLVLKGTFNDRIFFEQNFFTTRIRAVWRSSFLYRTLFVTKPKQKDVVRAVEMLKRMNTILTQHNLQFLVLVYPFEKTEPYAQFFYKALKKNNIRHFFINSIIPDLLSRPEYYFIPGDGHPNGNYNKKVAEFLAPQLSPCNDSSRYYKH